MSDSFCSFCDKPRSAVSFVVEKPELLICSQCIARFEELLKNPDYGENTELFLDCSFCSFAKAMPAEFMKRFTERNQGNPKGNKLIRHAGVSICDQCLHVCGEIARGTTASPIQN
jgi:ATP-dependent protease Clp ATPase subunit